MSTVGAQGGLNPGHPLFTLVAGIDPQMLQALKAAVAGLLGRQHAFQEPASALALAHVGCMDQHRQDQSEGVDQQVALAAIDFLDGVVAPFGPPFLVVLTD
jgi:hypothetical protein